MKCKTKICFIVFCSKPNLITGEDKEVNELRGGRGRGGRITRPEAEDFVPGEQPGAADEGPQAAGARQRGPALRAAQAGEAAAGHHGAGQGARDRAQGDLHLTLAADGGLCA